jgi:hypothetical protein
MSRSADNKLEERGFHLLTAPAQLSDSNVAPGGEGSPNSSTTSAIGDSETSASAAEVLNDGAIGDSDAQILSESARMHHAQSRPVQSADDLVRQYTYLARDPPPLPVLLADDSHLSANDRVDSRIASLANARPSNESIVVAASTHAAPPHSPALAPAPAQPALHSSRGDEHSIDRQLHLLHQRLEAQQSQLLSPAVRELAHAQHAHLQSLQHQRQQQQQQPRHRPGASTVSAPSHFQSSMAASSAVSSSSNAAASAALPAAGGSGLGPAKQRRAAADGGTDSARSLREQQASITDPELAKVCWRLVSNF